MGAKPACRLNGCEKSVRPSKRVLVRGIGDQAGSEGAGFEDLGRSELEIPGRALSRYRALFVANEGIFCHG